MKLNKLMELSTSNENQELDLLAASCRTSVVCANVEVLDEDEE